MNSDIENYKAKRRDYVLAKYIIKALKKQGGIATKTDIEDYIVMKFQKDKLIG